MMLRRVAIAGVVGMLSITAACSSGSTPAASSTSAAAGSPAASAPASASPTSAAQGSSAGSGTEVTPADLSDRLVAGYQDVTSGKGTLQAGAAGQMVDATFEGTFDNGTPSGISVTMTIPMQGDSVPFDVILADGNFYLSSPPLLSQLGITKKWLLISPDSTNPTVAQLGEQIQGTLQSLGSPDQTAKLAASATSVTEIGTEDHNGQQATHYQLTLDPEALAAAEESAAPSADAAMSSAAAAVTEPIIVQMWVNADDRVIGTTTDTEASGQQVTAVYEVTSFNDPVTITAPDASEVATG